MWMDQDSNTNKIISDALRTVVEREHQLMSRLGLVAHSEKFNSNRLLCGMDGGRISTKLTTYS